MTEEKWTNLIYDRPICHSRVPIESAIDPRPDRSGEPGAPAKVYCPHCEMLVLSLLIRNTEVSPQQIAISQCTLFEEVRGSTSTGCVDG
jgi:hypothetical protein